MQITPHKCKSASLSEKKPPAAKGRAVASDAAEASVGGGGDFRGLAGVNTAELIQRAVIQSDSCRACNENKAERRAQANGNAVASKSDLKTRRASVGHGHFGELQMLFKVKTVSELCRKKKKHL